MTHTHEAAKWPIRQPEQRASTPEARYRRRTRPSTDQPRPGRPQTRIVADQARRRMWIGQISHIQEAAKSPRIAVRVAYSRRRLRQSRTTGA